jgi:hypothetical protein
MPLPALAPTALAANAGVAERDLVGFRYGLTFIFSIQALPSSRQRD